MCYATKRKIADCVKELVNCKEIHKITIQDIMHKTNMSRQSFYYHFQDIYDVFDWIVLHDFLEATDSEGIDIEEWILGLIHLLEENHVFYEKIAHEIPWPQILRHVKEPMEERVEKVLKSCVPEYCISHAEEVHFGIQFFATSLCYYLMDFVYQNRKVTDDEILRELHFLVSLWKGFQETGKYQGRKIPDMLSA